MLTQVSALNSRSGTLLLPLMDSSAGYVVRDIQGLDPVKATLTSSSRSQMDGGEFHHARREPRNIVMKLGLEADFVSTTVAGLRSNLYHFFMPKSPVALNFEFDDVLFATASGIVESCENNMFTADPEVDISVVCYDPDFYAPDPVHIDGMTVNGQTTETISYEGTSDCGIKFTMTFPGSASEITLYNTRSDEKIQQFRIEGSFIANDILTIDTNPGSKSVKVTRSGLVSSGLSLMDEQASDWISLTHGDNEFRAYYPGTSIAFDIEYTPRYGGF